MRRSPLVAALLAGASIIAPVTQAHAAEAWSFHADHVLGTSLDMVVVAIDRQAADMAFAVAQREIARLDAVLSGWRPDSELARLNTSSLFQASRELFAVIQNCESWRERTAGAFSARLGSLEALLRNGVEVSRNAAIAGDLNAATVSLDPASRTIERPQDMIFAVDGLAKGYVIDRALEAARSLPGIDGVMLDIGGDMRCSGTAPNGGGWRVGVLAGPCAADNASPAQTIRLSGNAVATSGHGPRGRTAIDPLTGRYAENVAMATVVANTATDADAMASAFSVMAPQDSLTLADATPGVAARIVTANGDVHVSAVWKTLEACNDMRVAQAGSAWPPGYAVTVNYEIPNLGSGRRPHNPYVTIWISDQAGNPVRSLLFLATKARYMDENFVFWEKIGASKPDLVYAITKPTRPPGSYNLVWDGKDDAGKPVPQGKYVVNIEAAREHGGHDIQRLPISAGTAPTTADAGGGGELGATHIRYGANP
jgi:thiamine biosynthesis lipoprotein